MAYSTARARTEREREAELRTAQQAPQHHNQSRTSARAPGRAPRLRASTRRRLEDRWLRLHELSPFDGFDTVLPRALRSAAAVRAMAPFRILDLPEDLLRRVAAVLGHSAPVVACSSRDPRIAAVRHALRAGVDEAERQRCPGALTVRDAEAVLRAQLPLTYESRQRALAYWSRATAASADEILVSRYAAGHELQLTCVGMFHGQANQDCLDLILPLLSFGGTPDLFDTTALHYVVSSGNPRSPEITALLISAGADVDATYNNYGDGGGTTPLAWAIKSRSSSTLSKCVYNYQCANVLLEARCDVRMANDDCVSNNRNSNDDYGMDGPVDDLIAELRAMQHRLEGADPEPADLLKRLNSQVLEKVSSALADSGGGGLVTVDLDRAEAGEYATEDLVAFRSRLDAVIAERTGT